MGREVVARRDRRRAVQGIRQVRAVAGAAASLPSERVWAVKEGLLSSDEQGNVLHGVAAVAQAVPVRPLGLRAAGKIGCAGP